MLAALVGLTFMVLGIWGMVAWWVDVLTVFKGLLPAMILCGGLLSVIAGITSIKASVSSKSVMDELEVDEHKEEKKEE